MRAAGNGKITAAEHVTKTSCPLVIDVMLADLGAQPTDIEVLDITPTHCYLALRHIIEPDDVIGDVCVIRN